MISILFFIISVLSCIIGTISGVGGGVIIKPALDATGIMSVSAINFLSGCTVFTMSLVSLLKSRKSNVVIDTKKATFLAVGSAIGGILGKYTFDIVKGLFANENSVGAIQAVLLLLITGGVLLYILNKEKIKTKNVTNIIACLIIGLLLGLVSAFLGIGGGPINIIVLFYYFSMEAKCAAKTSIYLILFSQIASLSSTVVTNSMPQFEVLHLVVLLVGGIIGGLVGANITKKVSDKTVERSLILALIIIMAISAFNTIKFFI